ncbi:N-formylglutamate amidohydrolase [Brucepastera parasyntrophica]|uniref:N-formylglutamate amidohydrolase n=1 Tax=Brucepastera parasyntrophica TaxID=2880008 RepID=UPI00210CED67|nr:N-formylglutamate amidohydrolase [Brucepastera parasyntrophica]
MCRTVTDEEKKSVYQLYTSYHTKFTELVQQKLNKAGFCIIFDCHSFNNTPLPFELENMKKKDISLRERPDICIGIDTFHTPDYLLDSVRNSYEDAGFSVEINYPYSGSIIPMKFYRKNRDVSSIMFEINKGLYLHEGFSGNEEKIKRLNKVFKSIIYNIT